MWAPRLGGHPALKEDLCIFPIIHVRCVTAACDSSSYVHLLITTGIALTCMYTHN